MIKNILLGVAFILCLASTSVIAGECSLYETAHPNYPLTGSHLSTGKCTVCSSCHLNGVFVGTPKICGTCHVTNSAYGAIGRSTNHFPIGSTDCVSCHNTTSYVTTWNMDHSTVTALSCATCHAGTFASGYNALGQAASPKPHPPTPTGADCGSSGCHSAPAPGMNLSESLWVLNLQQIHFGITTGCVTCHNGTYATGKVNVAPSTSLPNGHPTTSDACETCHSINASFKCADLWDMKKMKQYAHYYIAKIKSMVS